MAGRGFLLQLQARSLKPALPKGSAGLSFAGLCLPAWPRPLCTPMEGELCFPAVSPGRGDGAGELWDAQKARYSSSDMGPSWERVEQSRQEAGQEGKACQHHGVSWEEDRDASLGITSSSSSSGYIVPSSKGGPEHKSRARIPEEEDESDFLSDFSFVSAGTGQGSRPSLLRVPSSGAWEFSP